MARYLVMGVVAMAAVALARLVQSPCHKQKVLATDSKPEVATVTAGTTVTYPRMFYHTNWPSLADEIARGTTVCAAVRIQRSSANGTEMQEEVVTLSRHRRMSDSSTQVLQSSPGASLTLGNAEFQIDVIVAATPGHQAVISGVLVPVGIDNAATSPSGSKFAEFRQQIDTYDMTIGVALHGTPPSTGWIATWCRSQMAVVPPIAGSWRGAVPSRHGSVFGYLPQTVRLAWASAEDGGKAVLEAGGMELQLAESQARQSDRVAMEACRRLVRPEAALEARGHSQAEARLSPEEVRSCQLRSLELVRVLNSHSRAWNLPGVCRDSAGPLLLPPALLPTSAVHATVQRRPTLPIVESEEALAAVIGEKEACSSIAVVVGSECRQAALHALANWPRAWLVVSTAGVRSGADPAGTGPPGHPLERLEAALCEGRRVSDGLTTGERGLAGFGPRAGLWRSGASELERSLDAESVDLVLLASIGAPSAHEQIGGFEAGVEAVIRLLTRWWRPLRRGGVLAGERFRDQSGFAGNFTVIGAAVTRFAKAHRVPFGLSHGGEARPTWFIRKR
jgi:hypothetical protein